MNMYSQQSAMLGLHNMSFQQNLEQVKIISHEPLHINMKSIYPNRYIIIYVENTIQQVCLQTFNYCLVEKKIQNKLENLFLNAETVYVILKNKSSQTFTGVGKIASRLDSLNFCPTHVLDQLMQIDQKFQASEYNFFLIEWITRNQIHFQQTKSLINSFQPNYPFYTSKNGQEINEETGLNFIKLIIQNQNPSSDKNISEIDSPESSESDESVQQQQTQFDPKNSLIQSQVSMNPITLAYPPQPPYGLNHYLSNIPMKLFILPLLLQNEKKGAWTKGPGGLAEFLLKKMKNEIEGEGSDKKKSRSKSRKDKKKKNKKRSSSYDRRRRSRSDRRSQSRKKKQRNSSKHQSRSVSRDHKKKKSRH